MTYPFAAGDPADVSMINHLGAECLDAVNVTANPIITAAAFSSETDIPKLQLTASVTTGELYLFWGQIRASVTNTDTEANLFIRVGTAVSGTLVGTVRIGRKPVISAGELTTWMIPWACTATISAQNFYTSVQRGAGTGNTTLEGGDSCWAGICRWAPGSGVLRTVS